MTKVTPSPRKGAFAATAGLATIGAIAGAVPAHAADTSFPVNTNISAVTGLLSHGTKNALPLQSIPVVGTLVQKMMLAADPAPMGAGNGSGLPLARSAMPSMSAMSAVPSMAYMPAAEPTSSSPLSLTSLAGLLPKKLQVASVDNNSLPLRSGDSNAVNLPVLGGATSAAGLIGLL